MKEVGQKCVATIILPHSFDEENLTIGRQVGPAPRQRAAFALLSTTSPSLWTHFGPDLMWHERYDALPWRPNYTLAYSLTAEPEFRSLVGGPLVLVSQQHERPPGASEVPGSYTPATSASPMTDSIARLNAALEGRYHVEREMLQ